MGPAFKARLNAAAGGAHYRPMTRATGESFGVLARGLSSLFARGVARPLPPDEFDCWALRVFRWQLARNENYRGYCADRGATADTVTRWEDIPPVPTSAFRHVRLDSLEPGRSPEAVFRTSGTTRGPTRRGEHAVASLALYRAAVLPPFQAHVLPEGGRLPLLAMMPSPSDVADSSLSHMVATVMAAFGGKGSAWLVGADGTLAEGRLLDVFAASESGTRPVLVVSTAFALVHVLDLLEARNTRVRLPDGSRLMETGGFKGRSRTVARGELYAGVHYHLGIPPEMIVNEYGMTELMSQFYEPVLKHPDLGRGLPSDRFHVPPPWVRTRVLDPITLGSVADGREGLLCHLDLANAGSVACVLTDDLGVALPRGFKVLGRIAGAEPRGCSLTVEELLRGSRNSGLHGP